MLMNEAYLPSYSVFFYVDIITFFYFFICVQRIYQQCNISGRHTVGVNLRLLNLRISIKMENKESGLRQVALITPTQLNVCRYVVFSVILHTCQNM